MEIQEECAEMALRSATYITVGNRTIDIVRGDIKEAAEIFETASFHAVTSNQPYMIGQHGLQNPYMAKAIARHEIPLYSGGCGQSGYKGFKGQRTFLYGTPTKLRLVEIFRYLPGTSWNQKNAACLSL